MEAMGIRMFFNKREPNGRGGSQIYLAGVDGAPIGFPWWRR